MAWTPETIRFFVGGLILGGFFVSIIGFIIFFNIFEKEYNDLWKQKNDLYRQNRKLIAFIKEQKWRYDHAD